MFFTDHIVYTKSKSSKLYRRVADWREACGQWHYWSYLLLLILRAFDIFLIFSKITKKSLKSVSICLFFCILHTWNANNFFDLFT